MVEEHEAPRDRTAGGGRRRVRTPSRALDPRPTPANTCLVDLKWTPRGRPATTENRGWTDRSLLLPSGYVAEREEGKQAGGEVRSYSVQSVPRRVSGTSARAGDGRSQKTGRRASAPLHQFPRLLRLSPPRRVLAGTPSHWDSSSPTRPAPPQIRARFRSVAPRLMPRLVSV